MFGLFEALLGPSYAVLDALTARGTPRPGPGEGVPRRGRGRGGRANALDHLLPEGWWDLRPSTARPSHDRFTASHMAPHFTVLRSSPPPLPSIRLLPSLASRPSALLFPPSPSPIIHADASEPPPSPSSRRRSEPPLLLRHVSFALLHFAREAMCCRGGGITRKSGVGLTYLASNGMRLVLCQPLRPGSGCVSNLPRWGNPRYFWCYADEDMIGHMKAQGPWERQRFLWQSLAPWAWEGGVLPN